MVIEMNYIELFASEVRKNASKTAIVDRGTERTTSYAELDTLVDNSRHVGYDMMTHAPSHYDGPCLYFKPKELPAAATGGAREYWDLMKNEYAAGGYENYCSKELLTVLETPHEHDLMMDNDSLDIIVPSIYQAILPDKG